MCGRIEDSSNRDACYYSIAVNTARPNACRSILSNASKYRCLAITKKDASECENIVEEKARDLCYLRVASVKPEKASCERIIDDITKDNCYGILAEALASKEFCNRVENESVKKLCQEKASKALDRLNNMQKNFGLNDSIKIKTL